MSTAGTPQHLFNCQFDFHPVGQGLFYTGRVKDFRFVYDCGSNSSSHYLENAITCYLCEENQKRIDLLIISHFHEDHINGIQQLIKKAGQVSTIVMPYLFPEERLMVAAEQAIMTDSRSLDADYIQFLVDPIDYIRADNRDIPIVFLRAGETTNEQVEISNEPAEGWGWRNRPPKVLENDTENIYNKANTNIYEDSACFASKEWMFRFYCQKSRRASKDARIDVIEKLVKWNIGYDPQHPRKSIENTLRNNLDKLKEVYYDLFSGSYNQNNTSVICLHGPRHSTEWISYTIKTRRKHVGPPHSCRHVFSEGIIPNVIDGGSSVNSFLTPPLQLLPGDAILNIDGLKKHFAFYLDNVRMALLPHHGSTHNWDSQLLECMKNCHLWIASFGLGNSYKHPGKSVVEALIRANKCVGLCHEIEGLRFLVSFR